VFQIADALGLSRDPAVEAILKAYRDELADDDELVAASQAAAPPVTQLAELLLAPAPLPLASPEPEKSTSMLPCGRRCRGA
jgi:hypothetical protein